MVGWLIKHKHIGLKIYILKNDKNKQNKNNRKICWNPNYSKSFSKLSKHKYIVLPI